MKERFTSAGAEDFRRRYENTFGWILLRNERQFAEIKEVSEFEVKFSLGGNVNFYISADAPIDFEFAPLNRAWYNTPEKNKIYYVERLPARQWKRGICNTNTRIVNSLLAEEDISYDVLKSIYDPVTPYPKGTLNNATAVALSPHFAISAGNIFFYQDQIGVYDYAGVITLDNDLVLQELSDLILERDLNIKVRCK